MVAFHFPPAAGSSGIQRTLRFVQQLPALGWQPTVLSVRPQAHERTSADLLADVPASTPVVRAFGLDTARHLAVAGRYPGFLARPDRWQTWRIPAVRAGLALLRKHRFDALWSTFPIATAHNIALRLQRRSGLPWIADFRDPMAQDGYPEDPRTWRCYQAIEAATVAAASRAVFTTPGAARLYRERYPDLPADRFAVIENGYDEESFNSAGPAPEPTDSRQVLLHSGIVYASERDPRALLQALAQLKAAGTIDASGFCMRFRASEHDALIRGLADAAGVGDLVELQPAVPYRDALREMQQVDALVVMQASNCNEQIPAKLYEYLRAGRPVLGLCDSAGDTAATLRDAGIAAIAALDDAAAIATLIGNFVRRGARSGDWLPRGEAVARASRQARAVELAGLLDGVSAASR